jgi:hypothetical protein
MRLDLSARNLSPATVAAIVGMCHEDGKVERAYSGPDDAEPWPGAAADLRAVTSIAEGTNRALGAFGIKLLDVEGEDVPNGKGYGGSE